MRKPNYNNWSSKKCAKEYGYAHGYYGGDGGWIYHERNEPIVYQTREGVTNFKRSLHFGKPVCQGWETFYNQHKRQIEAWIAGLKQSSEVM